MINQNTKERKKIENYLGYIKNILFNREVESDDFWWDDDSVDEKIKKLIYTEEYEIYTSEDFQINCDELFIFIAYKKVENNDDFVKRIEEKINTLQSIENSKAVNIVYIVNNMKSRIYLEKLLESGVTTKLKKIINISAGHKNKRLNFTYVLDSDYAGQDVILGNINRFDFIQMPPISNHINLEKKEDENIDVEGYVMSIDLYQLVEMYNLLGDSLFKRNVRYGLSEQLGVDKAIKETLRTNPMKFWFRNNGITLLIEKSDFKLDRVGEIFIDKVAKGEDLSFSVVNGAQTITAAAEYFYSLEYEKEKCDLENKRLEIENSIIESKKAKVLLRILHVHKNEKADNEHEPSNKEVNEISVALNRQKPIKIEDIAFTSAFVEQLTLYLEEKSGDGIEYFKLAKRGESNIYPNGMDLIEFARARKACVRKPGDARSKSANAMLGADNKYGEEFKFNDTEVFVEDWIENEEQRDKLFNKYFKAIIFANKLAQSYEKDTKNLNNDNEAVNIVIKNGKWYFVSYMINLLNDFRIDTAMLPDYSEFDTTIDIRNLDIKKLVINFAQDVVNVALKSEELEFSVINSNIFKKDNLFNLVYTELDPEEYINIINSSSEKKLIITNKPILDKKARVKAIKVSKIVVYKKERTVKNPTEAIVHTYDILLQDNQDKIDEFINKYPRILTFDKNKKDGFFRNSKTLFKSNNKMLYIGTSSSFADKVLFIGYLSDFIGCEKGSIKWMDNEECVYSN